MNRTSVAIMLMFVAIAVANADMLLLGVEGGSASGGIVGALLLEDASSNLLLEDNASYLCLEGGCPATPLQPSLPLGIP
jgi:hypothetical protein